MPHFIVIRLRPKKPVAAGAFTDYLKKLRVSVYDMSYSDPKGTSNLLGTATYDEPIPTDDNKIYQHYFWTRNPVNPLPNVPPNRPADISVVWSPVFWSLGTAVVKIDNPPPTEYLSRDLRIELSRDGKKIRAPFLEYNAQTYDLNLPGVVQFPVPHSVLVKCDANDPNVAPHSDTTVLMNSPASAHIELPDPGVGRDPALGYVELPEDGVPPSYGDLKDAVQKVLAKDPAAATDLSSISPKQAQHIANELIWNRNLFPAPDRRASELQNWFTDDATDPEKAEIARFEGELIAYHMLHSAEARQLAQYVYALAAAHRCQELSEAAASARLDFPVQPSKSPIPNNAVVVKN
jgi:hypothetical protein